MSSTESDREAVLAVKGVSAERGAVTILRNITWTVRRGEQWAILGANGSGKTSLLNSLMGYFTPSAGTVTLLGEEFGRTDWRELRKRVGIAGPTIGRMVPPEEEALDVVVGGRQAIVGLWARPTARERKEAADLLRRVDCGALVEREWRFLSQGERQRVLIARAMMADPKVLILDEPCAGLDPVAREHFLEFLDELVADAHAPAILFVTHHVEEITPAFTHALVLAKGRVLGEGAKDQVLRTEILEKAFGAKLKISRHRGRYRMEVTAPRKRNRVV